LTKHIKVWIELMIDWICNWFETKSWLIGIDWQQLIMFDMIVVHSCIRYSWLLSIGVYWLWL